MKAKKAKRMGPMAKASARIEELETELANERAVNNHVGERAECGTPLPIPVPTPPPADNLFAHLNTLNDCIRRAWQQGLRPAIYCRGAEVHGLSAVAPAVSISLSGGKESSDSPPYPSFGRS